MSTLAMTAVPFLEIRGRHTITTYPPISIANILILSLFRLFSVFFKQTSMQSLQQINVKTIHPV